MLGNASDVHDGVDVEALAYLVIVIIMRAFGGTLTSVTVTPLGLYLKLRYLECRQHHDSCRLDLKLRGSVFARCAWVPPSLVGAGSMSRVCCHRLSATGSGSMLSLPHHAVSSPERKNPRALAGRLRRSQVFLRALGIEITGLNTCTRIS